MILELAVKAGCDSVVAYNIRDFVGVDRFGLTVITPAEFLQSIGALS
ncbi:twitching motility protein PilT [[Phormidium ambiguum] IAM M-71]|nr:twitching motility protein PilT [Phormidium ambiguum]